jgi:divalent metal cation (Fe/Co/Zn/Cd) transporter
MIAKVLLGIFIGICVSAAAYELIKSSYPIFMKKVEKKAKKKIDKVLDDKGSKKRVKAKKRG